MGTTNFKRKEYAENYANKIRSLGQYNVRIKKNKNSYSVIATKKRKRNPFEIF
jgi:hypothetical protein